MTEVGVSHPRSRGARVSAQARLWSSCWACSACASGSGQWSSGRSSRSPRRSCADEPGFPRTPSPPSSELPAGDDRRGFVEAIATEPANHPSIAVGDFPQSDWSANELGGVPMPARLDRVTIFLWHGPVELPCGGAATSFSPRWLDWTPLGTLSAPSRVPAPRRQSDSRSYQRGYLGSAACAPRRPA